MKTRAALCALMLCHAAAAWSATISVGTVEVRGTTTRGEPLVAGSVTMPFIRSDDAALAARINDALFLGELGMLARRNPGQFVTAGAGIEPMSQGFTVDGEGGPVLSINFQIEGCGAYCETYHSVHNFDTASGRRVNDVDLVTAPGMRELARQMMMTRLSAYTIQLADLAARLKAEKQRDVRADLEERIALNGECADMEREKLADESGLAQAFSYYTQQHAGQALVLTSGRCSNHAMRALDDVGDVTMPVPYAKLRPWLTGYGKALLLGEGTARASGMYRQLLRGHINGIIPITMQLANERGNSVNGVYLYDKVGKPIKLVGKREGNELTLMERLGEEETAGATIKLVVTGSQLKGQWIGKKQLAIQLNVP
ncbi:MAG: hypothetical protein V4693_02915 [Pseudomonadota bacterium]